MKTPLANINNYTLYTLTSMGIFSLMLNQYKPAILLLGLAIIYYYVTEK